MEDDFGGAALASHARSQPRQGEAEDAGRLFAQHGEEVLRHCRRRLGSLPEAEDAAQTTFLYALRALERGEAPRSEIAWLIAIATNVCRSQRRSQARRAPIDDAVDVEALPSHVRADERDVLAELPRALASMPERQRRALLLREWRGLTTHEVAAVLGTSATATHALLTRARRSLADALLATSRSLAVNVVTLLVAIRRTAAGWLAGGGKVAATGAAAAVVACGAATQIDGTDAGPVPTAARSVVPPARPGSDAGMRPPTPPSRPLARTPAVALRGQPARSDVLVSAAPRGVEEEAPRHRDAAEEPRPASPAAEPGEVTSATAPVPPSPATALDQAASPQPPLELPAVEPTVDGLPPPLESVTELTPPPLAPLPDAPDPATDALAPVPGDVEALAPG